MRTVDTPASTATHPRVGLALARSDTDQKDWQTLIVTLKVPLQIAPTPTPGASSPRPTTPSSR